MTATSHILRGVRDSSFLFNVSTGRKPRCYSAPDGERSHHAVTRLPSSCVLHVPSVS